MGWREEGADGENEEPSSRLMKNRKRGDWH